MNTTTRREVLKVCAALCAASGMGWVIGAAQSAAAASRLLLVHGRAQERKDPKALKAAWLEALGQGAAKSGQALSAVIDIAFPYYGDVLDDFVRQAKLPLPDDVKARGPGGNEDYLLFKAEMAEELRVGAGVSDEEIDEQYGADPRTKGLQNWEWVQAILRAIDKKTAMTEPVLEQFMRDVYLYLTRLPVRTEIDRIVRATLTEEPTVVVAHSLGSVVTYSILRSEERKLDVPLYLTVGSPLALRPIQKRFRPLKSPPNVTAWYNAFDKRDVVALYPLDAKNFSISPPVENYDAIRNKTSNRHGIAGYLDDDKVAARVLGALTK